MENQFPQLPQKAIKKHFTVYLLEFIVLFLAVAVAYYAIQLKDHMNDEDKEKQYMSVIVNDLKCDTAEFDKSIITWRHILQVSDTMMAALKTIKDTQSIRTLYQKIAQQYFLFESVRSNSHSLQKLSGSNTIDWLKNQKALDSINAYDEHVKSDNTTLLPGLYQSLIAVKDAERKVVDYSMVKPYQKYNRDSSQLVFDSTLEYPSAGTFKLISNWDDDLNNYYNALYTYYVMSNGYVTKLEEHKREAANLIRHLTEKYQQPVENNLP
ncbi:MAG TPA: hypothetical protein VFQ58_03475 [Flavisolibacter sp.]|nr:hypothetical protein [Flavisolibacter sp.]